MAQLPLHDRTEARPGQHPEGRRYRLTRESLLDGSHHARIAPAYGPNFRFMTDAERAAHIEGILARAPRPGSVWVFGYGSLMWNPAFHFVEERTARIHGFHRQFCLWARAGRGSPERPGLMLSLESGGSCSGVAYRIARDAVKTELDILWRREMRSLSYRPLWVTAHTQKGAVQAIVFAVNRSHERYVPGLDAKTVVRYLANGAGLNGNVLRVPVRHGRSPAAARHTRRADGEPGVGRARAAAERRDGSIGDAVRQRHRH